MRGQGTSIGFGAEVRGPDDRRTGEILRDLEPEDLLRYGLIPEFIGRLPVIATLEDLDEAALVEILTEPKNALVKQYQRLFDMENVKLTFTDDALRAVAQKAILRKTGARGLRSIMEGILLETMFELPSLDGVEEVVVNGEVIEGRAQPLYVHGERKEGIAARAGLAFAAGRRSGPPAIPIHGLEWQPVRANLCRSSARGLYAAGRPSDGASAAGARQL